MNIPGLGEAFPKKGTREPSQVEKIWYFFFDKGISLKEFNELPIPYILSMINCSIYEQEQMEKKRKK